MRTLVRGTLHALEPEIKYSIEAENLICGTGAQESAYGKYRKQINGPALGIIQMEPATFNDIVNNFLRYHPNIADKIKQIAHVNVFSAADLVNNDKLAICFCRLQYYRQSAPIPTDLNAQAAYYKQYYNTPKGKATTDQYLENYKKYVVPDVG